MHWEIKEYNLDICFYFKKTKYNLFFKKASSFHVHSNEANDVRVVLNDTFS